MAPREVKCSVLMDVASDAARRPQLTQILNDLSFVLHMVRISLLFLEFISKTYLKIVGGTQQWLTVMSHDQMNQEIRLYSVQPERSLLDVDTTLKVIK